MLITVILIAVTCAVSITCFSNERLLDRLLHAKIERPQLDLGREGAGIVRAAVQLITTE